MKQTKKQVVKKINDAISEAVFDSMGWRAYDAQPVKDFLFNLIPKEIKDTLKDNLEPSDTDYLMFPKIDTIDNTVINPSFIEHFAFSVKEEPYIVLMNEDPESMYFITLYYLAMKTSLPQIMLEGKCGLAKEGMVVYHNEYQTTVRLWKTFPKDDNVMFYVSVASYKNAIPAPYNIKDKKKITVSA